MELKLHKYGSFLQVISPKRQTMKRCTRFDAVNNCTPFEKNKKRGINCFIHVLQVYPFSALRIAEHRIYSDTSGIYFIILLRHDTRLVISISFDRQEN